MNLSKEKKSFIIVTNLFVDRKMIVLDIQVT